MWRCCARCNRGRGDAGSLIGAEPVVMEMRWVLWVSDGNGDVLAPMLMQVAWMMPMATRSCE